MAFPSNCCGRARRRTRSIPRQPASSRDPRQNFRRTAGRTGVCGLQGRTRGAGARGVEVGLGERGDFEKERPFIRAFRNLPVARKRQQGILRHGLAANDGFNDRGDHWRRFPLFLAASTEIQFSARHPLWLLERGAGEFGRLPGAQRAAVANCDENEVTRAPGESRLRGGPA